MSAQNCDVKLPRCPSNTPNIHKSLSDIDCYGFEIDHIRKHAGWGPTTKHAKKNVDSKPSPECVKLAKTHNC